jgi:hypothetical protein
MKTKLVNNEEYHGEFHEDRLNRYIEELMNEVEENR